MEEVKTLSLPKIKENEEQPEEDYFDESNLEEKSSKMESPEIIKGDDSNPESRDSLDRRETEKLQSAPGTLESSGIKEWVTDRLNSYLILYISYLYKITFLTTITTKFF